MDAGSLLIGSRCGCPDQATEQTVVHAVQADKLKFFCHVKISNNLAVCLGSALGTFWSIFEDNS